MWIGPLSIFQRTSGAAVVAGPAAIAGTLRARTTISGTLVRRTTISGTLRTP